MDSSKRPLHWDLLCESDKAIYEKMLSVLSAPKVHSRKNTKLTEFKDALDAIKIFEDHEPEEKWKRCLVCGVCFFEAGIAVNITQLRKLILKCKSSINGCLNEMGYSIVVSKVNGCSELFSIIPYLNKNYSELKCWTVRMYSKPSPILSSSIVNDLQNQIKDEGEEKDFNDQVMNQNYENNTSLDDNLLGSLMEFSSIWPNQELNFLDSFIGGVNTSDPFDFVF